jgi:hypothetical protein
VSAAAYRARSATELIDATFQLLRRNAAGLFTLSALFVIPNSIASTLLVPKPSGTTLYSGAMASLGGFMLYGIAALALSCVFQTALLIAASDAYLGRTVDVADSLKRALPKALPIFIAYILVWVGISIGFFFFIIPGVLFALSWYAIPCAIVFENAGIPDAFSRSSELSKGLKGHVFLTFLLAFTLLMVGYIIVFAIAGLTSTVSVYVQLIVQAIGLTFVQPLVPLVVVLLYYDARIRKEGYDIELMSNQVGGSAATAAKPQPA